jgi:hypothetical protein
MAVVYRYRAASNPLFLSFFFFEIESINFILFLLFVIKNFQKLSNKEDYVSVKHPLLHD